MVALGKILLRLLRVAVVVVVVVAWAVVDDVVTLDGLPRLLFVVIGVSVVVVIVVVVVVVVVVGKLFLILFFPPLFLFLTDVGLSLLTIPTSPSLSTSSLGSGNVFVRINDDNLVSRREW